MRRHALHYLAVRLALGAVTLGSYALFSRLTGPAEWGRYTLVIASATALTTFLFGWMGIALLRDPRPARASAIVALFMAAVGGLCVLAAMASALVPPLVAMAVLAVTLAMAWYELSLHVSLAHHDTRGFATKSLVRGGLLLALGGTAALAGTGAAGLVMATLAAFALTAAACLPADRAALRLSGMRTDTMAELLRFGWPVALGLGLGWVVDVADRFLVFHLLGEAHAGRYAMGYDIAKYPIWLVLSASSLATLPAASRALDRDGPEAARGVVAGCFTTMMLVGAPVLAIEALCAAPLTAIVLGPDYRDAAARLMPVVALALALQGMRTYLLDISLQLARRTRPLIAMGLCAAITNIAANVVLIPSFGLMGAAWATVLAHLAGMAWYAAFVHRDVRHLIAVNPSDLARLLPGLALLAVIVVAQWLPPGDLWLLPKLAAAGLAYGLSCLLLDVGGIGGQARRLLARKAPEVP